MQRGCLFMHCHPNVCIPLNFVARLLPDETSRVAEIVKEATMEVLAPIFETLVAKETVGAPVKISEIPTVTRATTFAPTVTMEAERRSEEKPEKEPGSPLVAILGCLATESIMELPFSILEDPSADQELGFLVPISEAEAIGEEVAPTASVIQPISSIAKIPSLEVPRSGFESMAEEPPVYMLFAVYPLTG